MRSILNLRRPYFVAAGLLVFAFAATGLQAQTLPAMPPTDQAGAGSPASSAAVDPAANVPLHADVVYTNGQLQIRADNSSLNQILRSISHITGLKITGGVEEQRVFGSYGPAPLSTILATLLDGTGANILLISGNSGAPPELLLTPRAGGAELPGPNSPAYAMYDDSRDTANHVPPPGTRGAVAPAAVVAPGTTTSGADVPPASPAVTRAPGQPLTPEMVAQELMQMQAQQDQNKKALDQQMQRQQMDRDRRMAAPATQIQPNQPPASPSTPQ